MAVKVIVRGDSSGDYEFLVKSIRYERCCYEVEIVELLDSNNNLLYTIPVSSLVLVQFIQDDENLKLQEFVDGDFITQLCFDNNLSDASIECTRVNADKIMDLTVIEAYQYLGIDEKTKQDKWFKEFIVPISRIKFINHNFLIDVKELKTEATEENVSEVETKNETEIEVAPKKKNNSKKHQSKFNKK